MNPYARLYKLQAMIGKLVIDGRRDPVVVADVLQKIVDIPAEVPVSTTQKFALLVDLGIITVPDDYDHTSRLTTFGKQNRKKFYYYNDNITDQNFPNPTRVLSPGDKLRVHAFKQVVGGTTTSEERMAFLATQRRFTSVHREPRSSGTRSATNYRKVSGMRPSMRRIVSGPMPTATTGCRTCAATRTVTSGSTLAASRVSGAATMPSSASATSSSP